MTITTYFKNCSKSELNELILKINSFRGKTIFIPHTELTELCQTEPKIKEVIELFEKGNIHIRSLIYKNNMLIKVKPLKHISQIVSITISHSYHIENDTILLRIDVLLTSNDNEYLLTILFNSNNDINNDIICAKVTDYVGDYYII